MNMNLYHYQGRWLMVDMGVTFYDRLGVDIITPDPTFIEERRDQLLGLVLTHAHEDHIGAIPYLWERLKCPIYATPFTMEIVKAKLKDVGLIKQVPLHVVPLEGTLELGPFRLELLSITHSIPEPNMVMIRTDVGTLLHTGDWKFDRDPVLGPNYDIKCLKDLGDEGVMALLCDSTNAFEKGTSGTELSVQESLIECMNQYPHGRIVVACFASNVARLKSSALAAQKSGRQVVLAGRSLWRMDEAARNSGYLGDVLPFLDDEEGMALPREQALFLCTGSQGERRAALYRIATKTHPVLHLEEGDVVFFSSRMIPGNEKEIGHLKNLLVEQGVRVVTAREASIHVSGHPCQEELKELYRYVRPRTAIPVHGEVRHMTKQAELAVEWGTPHALVPRNGDVIRITPEGAHKVGVVPAGQWTVDGPRMIPLYGEVLNQRHKMSAQGAVFISVLIASQGQASTARVSTAGLMSDEPNREAWLKEITDVVKRTLSSLKPLHNAKEAAIKSQLEQALSRYFKRTFQKRPLIYIHCLS